MQSQRAVWGRGNQNWLDRLLGVLRTLQSEFAEAVCGDVEIRGFESEIGGDDE